MNKKGGLAVIGDADSIYAFKAIGAEVFAADDGSGAKRALQELIGDGSYAVIFITEQLAESIPEYLEELKSLTFPCVIPIPSAAGTTGYGMARITKDVEKALGADIISAD